ncbi:MAG: PHP domain-containing protein, partial [Peptococcaceae bacterium]
MELDYSCFTQKPNQDVVTFLKTASVRKITISQQSKVCEIFLACQQLPEPELYTECLRFFSDNMTQANGLRLVMQPTRFLSARDFLEQHFPLFLAMLQQQHPTIAGWLYHSYWQLDEEAEELTIFIGQQIGIRFLDQLQFSLQASILLEEILQERYTVHLQWDKAIKPPEIKKAEPCITTAPETKPAPSPTAKPAENLEDEIVILGKRIKDMPRAIESIEEEEKFVTIEGRMFGMDVRELKNGKQLLTFKITDDRDSILCKVIKEADEIKELKGKLKKVKALRVKGSIRQDNFARELTMMAFDLNLAKPKKRSDLSDEKRVELHLHTNMSANDALCDVGDLIQLAADMGHEAIAITDHGVVQSFPEAYHAGQAAGVKIIYGLEGYIFNDDLPKQEQRTYHCIILAKNKAGLKALYQLVTESNLNFFYRRPRIPKRLLAAVRENLVIGSACEAGELIQTYIKTRKDHEALVEIASFYDFLEVQPHGNNEFMLRKGIFQTEDELKQINLDIYALGQELGKLVVATGDVHFANKDDSIYRAILMAGKKFEDADYQAPLYYRNTEEMLAEFDYFPPEVAREIVITNPKKIIADFEDLKPVPDGLHSPVIEGAEDEIRNLTYSKAHELYGPELPEMVQKRITKELDSIIGNGFSVLYLIAHKLVKKSNDDGYLVGSRGSVGSSFVANMTGITEVNSLPPHYRCPKCYNTIFKDDGTYSAGADMPDAVCEKCGTPMIKDGHDIPFETFLGFKGDKVPDIDLNF